MAQHREGLPSTFGFLAAGDSRDPDTAYLVPLNGDTAGRYVPDGELRSGAPATAERTGADAAKDCRSTIAYFGVLRQAMATDTLEPAGIYVGTNTGTLFASSR